MSARTNVTCDRTVVRTMGEGQVVDENENKKCPQCGNELIKFIWSIFGYDYICPKCKLAFTKDRIEKEGEN